MKKDFRISKDINTIYKEQILTIKKDYTTNTEKLGIIVSQESRKAFQNNEGFKSRKNKVTFYINNFIKTKYSKTRKVSLDSDYDKSRVRKDNLQKQGFFPWEKSFDLEEDSLMPN